MSRKGSSRTDQVEVQEYVGPGNYRHSKLASHCKEEWYHAAEDPRGPGTIDQEWGADFEVHTCRRDGPAHAELSWCFKGRPGFRHLVPPR